MPLRPGRQFLRAWAFAFLVLLGLPTAISSKDAWIEVQSPNFTVISNAGEKEARKVADQFEQFRAVFHNTFPKLRVDLGKPLIIFAVKNEDSLKTLIPAYWESKGRAHPQGIYMPGEDRHYVAVRTDVETENPYQIVYHEYTHAIMNLNFRGLPVWLNEGLAEFFANSNIREKDVEIGKIAPYHLQTLRTERLIPIDTLLLADEQSPYYNEQNHASMFYAESWAIVHYLMLDPEARKRQLLTTFMSTWDATGDQLLAAQKTFGDLKKFEVAMESYARQQTFYVRRESTEIRGDPKSYASRVLPPPELDAQRALFYAHTQRPKEAESAVQDALKADPNLPLAYEAEGFLAYAEQRFAAAQAAFDRAVALQSPNYFPYYFAAEARLRSGPPSAEEAPQIIASLEKAIQMNPQFAPAYAALATVYPVHSGSPDRALALARKAAELEPGNLFYATNYGYVLANEGKTADAKTLALRIQQAARSPIDRANAQQLLSVIATREAYDQRVAGMNSSARDQQAIPVIVIDQKSVDGSSTGNTHAPTDSPANTDTVNSNPRAEETEYAVEGNIASADCADGPGKVTISVGKTSMTFRFAAFSVLQILSTAKQDSGVPPACANWNSRRVRLYFYKSKQKQVTGDLNTIQFF
ncbi:MAG: DUF1570 domain-containing protein [Candidatus Acidiferrum sp.]